MDLDKYLEQVDPWRLLWCLVACCIYRCRTTCLQCPWSSRHRSEDEPGFLDPCSFPSHPRDSEGLTYDPMIRSYDRMNIRSVWLISYGRLKTKRAIFTRHHPDSSILTDDVSSRIVSNMPFHILWRPWVPSVLESEEGWFLVQRTVRQNI